jgi:hypothetical protein
MGESTGQEGTGNFFVAGAAFDSCVSLWPQEKIELRDGACVTNKSHE